MSDGKKRLLFRQLVCGKGDTDNITGLFMLSLYAGG